MESDGNRPVKEVDTGESNIPDDELARRKRVRRQIIMDSGADPDDERLREVLESERESAETAAELLHLKYVERDLPRSDEELREIIGSIVDEVVTRRQEADRLQAASSVAPSRPTWVRNRRRAAILAAVLALVAIAAAVGLRPRNEIIPDELVGLWTTSQAGYTGRAFRITKESLTFFTSPRDSTFHTLTRVISRRARMARQFDIRYRGPDGRHDLSFYYLPADNVIEFRDQRGIVWVKARD